MNELYEKSLHKLELDKVLALLADQACSPAGKEQCLKIEPLTDADEIRLLQKQTSAACRMITLKGSPGLAGVSDVGASVDRAVRGGCLSPEELLRVAGVLKCARQAKAYADGDGMENDLNIFFAQITPNKYLEERIFNSIVSKDEIADAASRSSPPSAERSAARAWPSARGFKRSSHLRRTQNFCRSRS